MINLEDIKNFATQNGVNLFSTGYVGDKLQDDLKDYPYAISMAIRYPKFIINQIKSGPTITYFHQYRTMNATLDTCAMKIQSKILDMGYDAVYIPASQSDPQKKYDGLFSHKIAAVRSGLGFIGKNNMFISNEYGPAVRLSTILTNMKLPKSEETPNKCGDCMACFNACPSGAIYGKISETYARDEVFDARKCSEYMKKNYKHIGRGVVCGICIGVCKFSK